MCLLFRVQLYLNMPTNIKITQDFTKLNQLNKNAKQKLVTKVGILGNKKNRQGSQDNATIGAVHEFGSITKNIPRRSFLNDPLRLKAKEINATLAKSIPANITKNNGMFIVFSQIGAKAEQIVQQAFSTGGFGKWEDLKERSIKAKRSSSKLINTGQLRRSISSSVNKQ